MESGSGLRGTAPREEAFENAEIMRVEGMEKCSVEPSIYSHGFGVYAVQKSARVTYDHCGLSIECHV